MQKQQPSSKKKSSKKGKKRESIGNYSKREHLNDSGNFFDNSSRKFYLSTN